LAIFNAKNNKQPQALANILYTYIHKTAVDSTKTIKMKLGMNTERQEIYLPDKTRSMS
jgi:hypothetical protein